MRPFLACKWRRLALFALALLAGAGCGPPSAGPRPTPEGQTDPGAPDTSGIPLPPTRTAR